LVRELKNKLLSQALLAFSQVLFPIFTYPIITDALGADGLGKVNFTDAIAQFLVILAGLGVPLYGIREMATTNNDTRSNSFNELFSFQAIFVIPALVLLLAIGFLTQIPAPLLWLAAINIIASCLSCEWFLQGTESFLFIAVRSFIIKAVSFLLIIFFVNTKDDLVFYYMILVGAVVLTMLLNLQFILKQTSFRVKWVAISNYLKKINWVYLCYLLIAVYTLLDNVWLGLLGSTNAVGYYSLGYKLVRMSSMFIISLGVVFMPRIALHFANGNKQHFEEQVKTSQQIIFFLALPLGMFFFIMAPEIVYSIAGESFAPSISVIRIISFLPLLMGFSHLTGMQILIPVQKERVLFFFLLSGALLNMLLNFLLIGWLQQDATAIAGLTAELVIAASSAFYLTRKGLFILEFRAFLSNFLFSITLLPLAYLCRLWLHNPLSVLIFSLSLYALAYLLLHWKLTPDSIFRKIFLPA
jgi:O-antigen/teichoic acid export membrane protein